MDFILRGRLHQALEVEMVSLLSATMSVLSTAPSPLAVEGSGVGVHKR